MLLRLAFAALVAIASPASAQDYKVGSLRIDHPTARPTMPGQPGAAAYMMIENLGKQPDRLIGAKAAVASTTEIHSMVMEGTIMKMREIADIEIKPDTTIVMQPGDGYHLMLNGLKKPLKTGDRFPLTLTFEKAGKINVMVTVEHKAPAGKSAQPGAAGQQHQHKH